MNNKTRILESRESRVMSNARAMFRKMFPNGTKLFVNGGIQDVTAEDFVAYIRNMYRAAFNYFGISIARWYLEGKLGESPELENKTNTFKNVLNNILEAHLEEYKDKPAGDGFIDEDLDNLIDRHTKTIAIKDKSLRDELANREYEPRDDYTIVPVDSAEVANRYNKYTSWCIAHEGAFNNYTGKSGMFYFLLRKGFENIKPLPKNSPDRGPFDTYGTSMIAISIDSNVNLKTSTSRYNHDIDSSKYPRPDHIFTETYISDLIGQSFYEAFKPRFTADELAQDIIKSGTVSLVLSEDISVITYDGAYYLVNTKQQELLKQAGVPIVFDLPVTAINTPTEQFLVVSRLVDGKVRKGIMDSTGEMLTGLDFAAIYAVGPSLNLIRVKDGTTTRNYLTASIMNIPFNEIRERLRK